MRVREVLKVQLDTLRWLEHHPTDAGGPGYTLDLGAGRYVVRCVDETLVILAVE